MRILVPDAGSILIAAILAGITGCSDPVREDRVERPVVKGVTLERVELVSVPEQFAASGTVRAKNSAQLSARISGTVSAVHAKPGDRVGRGTLLLTLEAVESTAGAAGAAHAVEEALARKKLADVTFERFARLYEEQAVTRQELDTRRADRDLADRGLARAREAARSARAVEGYTRITSPVSGIVTARPVDLGMTVFPGMPLITVEELEGFRLEITAPQSLLGKVQTGQIVPVSFDDGTENVSGTVVEIVPRVDPLSRTFIVKLDIPSTGLRSGRFGRALFPIGERRGILVPRTALVERGQLSSVWTVDRGNVASMRLVKPGPVRGDRVEILAGLGAGERIVVGGVEKVTDGARIE
ncbi:efflux RND transporter periplasmic adaptor subunit [bacterium]|nr:efflux RND transporter periplasmic adaptor subunit [bacterium]